MKQLTLMNAREYIEYMYSITDIFTERMMSYIEHNHKQIRRQSTNGVFHRDFNLNIDELRFTFPAYIYNKKNDYYINSYHQIYCVTRDMNTALPVVTYFLHDKKENHTVGIYATLHFLHRFYERTFGSKDYPDLSVLAKLFSDYLHKHASIMGESRQLFYKNKVVNTLTQYLQTDNDDRMIFEKDTENFLWLKTFITRDMLTAGQIKFIDEISASSELTEALRCVANKNKGFGCCMSTLSISILNAVDGPCGVLHKKYLEREKRNGK